MKNIMLSTERRQFLSQLKTQARKTHNPNEQNDTSNYDLEVEASSMIEVLDQLNGINNIHHRFFTDVSDAFRLLIKDNPKNASDIFNSFSTLTELIRISALNRNIISCKLQEYEDLSDELDLIDLED